MSAQPFLKLDADPVSDTGDAPLLAHDAICVLAANPGQPTDCVFRSALAVEGLQLARTYLLSDRWSPDLVQGIASAIEGCAFISLSARTFLATELRKASAKPAAVTAATVYLAATINSLRLRSLADALATNNED